ncbi:MAG TPA: hypothetical protein VGX28_16945 [Frankiaceae bacterium]|jgi:hypothetical protein|nr:hypothetical protein [Frankiaceae bacterium]
MRTLALRTETLTDLTPDELSGLGGGGTTDVLTNTCVSVQCSGVPCLLSNNKICLEG